MGLRVRPSTAERRDALVRSSLAEDEGLTRGGLLFRPFIYVILLLLCISALFFRRRRTSYPTLSSIVMWFMIAAVGYELTYFSLAMGTMYRFSYPVVVVAVVGAVWTAVATVRDRGNTQLPPASPKPGRPEPATLDMDAAQLSGEPRGAV